MIGRFITKYIAVIVLATALLALFFPQVFSFIRPSWISYMLGFVMFGMGLTMNPVDFKIVFMRPKDILIGSLAQFVGMPFLAWILCRLFQLPPDLALGVILVGCCPGGTASNVITFLAQGDLALSVGMTTISTLLAPLLTPFLVWLMAGTYVNVDMAAMFLSIVKVVILPVAIGLTFSHFLPIFTTKVKSHLPAFSTIVIAMIVASVVSANSSKLVTTGWIVMAVVVLHNLLGYVLGFFVASMLHLSFPKQKAIGIEVGMQNSGLACSLSQQHFPLLGMASVPGAIFSVWHNISGALIARIFTSKKIVKIFQ